MIGAISKEKEAFNILREILGKKYIKSGIENTLDFIPLATAGINPIIIDNFRQYFKINLALTAQMLNISEPTLYRWTKNSKKLDRNSSIQLLEITHLFIKGIKIFNTQVDFFKWLDLPNVTLGGLKPLELIEMPGGISKIENLLGRIEHGIVS